MTKLSIIILTSCFYATILCLSDEMQEMVNMLHNTCVQETNVEEGLIERARKGDFADNDSLKCYMKCLFDQTGSVSDDGIIDVEAVVALLPPEMQDVASPIIKKCGTKTGATPCENVWLTHKCYFEGSPKDYFLI